MTTVIAYNLHPRLTINNVLSIFNIFGNVINVTLSNGFALVTYEEYDDAIDAINEITGQYLTGYPLIVKLYKPNMLR